MEEGSNNLKESDYGILVSPETPKIIKFRRLRGAPAATVSAATVPKRIECSQLYDPCTREPIENMIVLEKRIREIKKNADTVPISLYGLNNSTSNYDFIMNVFTNPNISLDEMVSFRLGPGGQVGSDIFEVLSRIFVLLGGIENVNPLDGGNFKIMRKIEGGASEIYDSTVEGLKKMSCKATRSMGISDITLIKIRNDKKLVKPTDPYCEVECDTIEAEDIKTYLMSVKWYKEEKNAEHYDLEKLYTASQKVVTAEQKPVSIIVFLKSKRDFEIAHNRSYRQYVREIGNTFFGWVEDIKPFLEDKRRELFEISQIKGVSPKDVFESQYLIPGSKPVLTLQLHQDIIVKGLCDRVEASSEDKLFLIGVLPRGGKTFIAGGIIREYLRRTSIKELNIFWLTAAPNETVSQVKGELIDFFQDFTDFEFINAKDVGDIGKATKPHRIIFCSSQLLVVSQKDREGIRKREFLKNLLTGANKLGLVFFDEAHKTGTGEKTMAEITGILSTYSIYNLPFIFLTATYYNILFDYKIQKQNTFIWDYTDVLTTRALATESEQANALENLCKRFGTGLVNAVVDRRKANGETLETMAKSYINFPDLYFLSADFNEKAKERFAEQNVYRPDSGFSLGSIFAINTTSTVRDVKTEDNKVRKDAYKIFENIANPRNMISLLTPDVGSVFEASGNGGLPLSKEEGTLIEPTILGRINRMSHESGSRFRLDEQPTLLMFMPVGGTGSNIFYLLCAWASLLMNHSYWRDNYEVACVIQDENLSTEDIGVLVDMDTAGSTNIHIINKNPKANIIHLERKLHCREDGTAPKGLIVLAGEKLSMGISLPCVDIVFLFNEKRSPDDIIQKMYRALTPSQGKKSAYVIDLNPVRSLAAIYGYTRASHEVTNTKSEILDIIYDTYTWDADVFEYSMAKGTSSAPLSFQGKLQELFEKAETDSEYRLSEDIGGYEKKLSENIRRGIDASYINKIKEVVGSKKLEGIVRRIGLSDKSTITIERGRLIIRTPRAVNEAEEGSNALHENEVNEEIIVDNFVDTIIDFVKYLSITTGKPTLKEAIEDYEAGAVNSDGVALKQNVVKMIKSRTDITGSADTDVLSKLFLEVVKDFALTSSEAVFRQMKGKIDEKTIRKNEVLSIIHRHLTPRQKQRKEHGEVFTPIKLVEKVLGHLPHNVWKNPDLKWIDPANGIGNFPIVAFYKLDEGLKEWEPNERRRRKHIIENMIYMIELQSSNNRIAKRIFESLCSGCKPNILTTDSTKIMGAKLKAKGFPEMYDIVMGNPPFQKGRNMMFYVEFIHLANRLIKDGGYLVYIIPNKILIPNKANESIKSFNPLYIYHSVNKDFLPTVISTTICGIICKKEPYDKKVELEFQNGTMEINLGTPTPTQYDDIRLKKLSDKILFGRDREYLTAVKNKPTRPHVYISRVWTRYSPDKPKGGDHVFVISDAPKPGDDGSGKYIEIPDDISKENLIWFLSRSDVMRFITKIYAGAMNVPAFLWDFIPHIALKSQNNADAYRLLGLNAVDEKLVKEILNDNKITVVENGYEEEETKSGGSTQRRFTRKVKRV